MKLLKIVSIIGILTSLFLVYVGYGVQELKANPSDYGSGCTCRISPDVQVIPIIIYALSVFFILLSVVGLKASIKK